MPGSAARRLSLAACLVAAVGACTLLNPLDAFGPPNDAGVATHPPAGDGGAPDASCVSARWPDRPAKDDAQSSIGLVFAAKSFAIGGDAGGNALGYDLDNVCTCPGPPSCGEPTVVKSACDTDGGVDNGGSAILDKFIALSVGAGSINDALQNGRGGFLVVLEGYDGSANDTNVQVSIFPSNGTEPPSPGGTSPVPRHDGTDRWTIDPGALYTLEGPPFISKIVDTHAYVANGVLVARMDLPLTLAGIEFDLRSAVVTGQITHDGASYRLDHGIAAGRWPTARLLTSLDTVVDPFSSTNAGLCGQSALYASIKGDVCAAVDLLDDPTEDGTSKQCNAVGITISFGAEPAVMAGLMNGAATTHLCGSSWADDCP